MSLKTPASGRPEPQPSPKSAAYHHGDLRVALIAAARQALETTAPEDITLKSLASRLGVSQPAPYRHFENRDSLLAAVAADGFIRFRDALTAAGAGGAPHDAFLRACLAYLEFGRSNTGVYRLMFASQLLRTSDDQTLGEAAQAAFGFLTTHTAKIAAEGQVLPTALWIWSTLHGLVMLGAEGLAGGPHGDGAFAEDVVRQMMDTLAPAARR